MSNSSEKINFSIIPIQGLPESKESLMKRNVFITPTNKKSNFYFNTEDGNFNFSVNRIAPTNQIINLCIYITESKNTQDTEQKDLDSKSKKRKHNNDNSVDNNNNNNNNTVILKNQINEGDFGIGYAHGFKSIGSQFYVFYHDGSNVSKLNALCADSKKIIATNDLDLIKRGVPELTDEFMNKFKDKTHYEVYKDDLKSFEYLENVRTKEVLKFYEFKISLKNKKSTE